MAYLGPFLIVLLLFELAVFAVVAGRIGLFPTLGLCLISAALGAAIAFQKGRESLSKAAALLQKREPLTGATIDVLFFLIAGLLFMFPGFLSDILALILLIPVTRSALKTKLSAFESPISRPANTPDDVIEGEYSRVDENGKDQASKHIPHSFFF